MADGIEFKLTGFKELGEQLQAMGPKLARNGLRASAFAGAAIVRDAAKRTTAFQDRTGTLRANIIAVKSRSGTKGDVEAKYRVTVRSKKKAYVNNARNRLLRRVGKKHAIDTARMYGRFLEFGTSRMAPHPYLRPALFNNATRAIEAMKERMAKAIRLAAQK